MNFFTKKFPPSLEPSIVLVIFALFSWIMLQDALTRQTSTETISIVTSLLPPYMDEHGRGREAEIIKAALTEAYKNKKRVGSDKKVALEISVRFYVQPFSRHWMSFLSDERYDAVTTVPEDLEFDLDPDFRPKHYKSNSYINFQNGIGFRGGAFPNRFENFKFDDLSGSRVVAFSGASRIISKLGEKRDMFALYLEEPNQKIHSKLLLEGLVDAVIADGAIFFEYNRRLNSSTRMPDASFSAVFCPTPYVMVFRSAEMRNDFNRGLKIIAENGSLADIEAKYSHDSAPQNAYFRPARCQQ